MHIENALYGRMALGRCVTENVGRVGCARNVTQTLRERCRGKALCQISVPHEALQLADSCEDLPNYLQVEYSCIPGE